MAIQEWMKGHFIPKFKFLNFEFELKETNQNQLNEEWYGKFQEIEKGSEIILSEKQFNRLVYKKTIKLLDKSIPTK